jgi:pimeloyl-ACP methyl ester carboxylesterase
MQRKTKRRFKWGLLIFIGSWILFAQSCMKFRISDSEAGKEFAQRGLAVKFETVHEDGVTLHYVKTGADSLSTLFFVHGSPGSWDAFKGYMMDPELLKRFRIISVDRPGFGYSDFGTAYHLPAQASLLNTIIEKENNGMPVHLVGHSIGGPVIIQMAQDTPAFFASLTILAGSVSPYDEPKEYWRYAFTYSPLKLLMPGAFKPSNDEIVYFKKELYRLDEKYHLLQMPVTFIHGGKDKFVTVKNVEYGKKKLLHNTQVKIILIPGAGHFIPWQHFTLIRNHLLTLP